MSRFQSAALVLLGLGVLGLWLDAPATAQAPATQACASFELPHFTMNTKTGNWLSYSRREPIQPTTDGFALPPGWTAVGGSSDGKAGTVVACR